MTPRQSKLASAKALAQQALASANQIERLNTNAIGIGRVFDNLSLLSRKSIAGTSIGSLTFAIVTLSNLAPLTKFISAPFFALGTGSAAVLFTPASMADKKRREIMELQEQLQIARDNDQDQLTAVIEERLMKVISADVDNITRRLYLGASEQKLLSPSEESIEK